MHDGSALKEPFVYRERGCQGRLLFTVNLTIRLIQPLIKSTCAITLLRVHKMLILDSWGEHNPSFN